MEDDAASVASDADSLASGYKRPRNKNNDDECANCVIVLQENAHLKH